VVISRVDELEAFRRDYTPPFLAYLSRRDEAGLRDAYELGRRAMSGRVGIIGLVDVHNQVFLDVLDTARSVESAVGTARAAAAFLVEALSSFEMTQRGFMDGKARLGTPPPAP
jgi:hypothetical protein